MSINITSTTDSPEAVKAATGGKLEDTSAKTEEVVEETPAGEEPGKAAASGTVEGEDGKKPEEPGKTEEGKNKDGKNLEKRFSKLTAKRKEAEMRADDAERRAAYWEDQAKQARVPKPAEEPGKTVETKPDLSKEPKQEDFESHVEYMKAWSKWDRAQETAQAKIEEAKATTKKAMDDMWASYSDKEKAFRKDHPEFMERLDAVKEAGIKMSPIVEDRIIRVGGPELANELMKDVDEFKALCAMEPADALEHIGIVRAQMKQAAPGKPTEENKKVTEVKQPKPVSPVGSKVTVIKDPEKMSLREYDAWRRAGNNP